MHSSAGELPDNEIDFYAQVAKSKPKMLNIYPTPMHDTTQIANIIIKAEPADSPPCFNSTYLMGEGLEQLRASLDSPRVLVGLIVFALLYIVLWLSRLCRDRAQAAKALTAKSDELEKLHDENRLLRAQSAQLETQAAKALTAKSDELEKLHDENRLLRAQSATHAQLEMAILRENGRLREELRQQLALSEMTARDEQKLSRAVQQNLSNIVQAMVLLLSESPGQRNVDITNSLGLQTTKRNGHFTWNLLQEHPELFEQSKDKTWKIRG